MSIYIIYYRHTKDDFTSLDLYLTISPYLMHVNIKYIALVNPLKPELNPTEQPCLQGFFTGDFKF
jgi:hypothetical protein